MKKINAPWAQLTKTETSFHSSYLNKYMEYVGGDEELFFSFFLKSIPVKLNPTLPEHIQGRWRYHGMVGHWFL